MIFGSNYHFKYRRYPDPIDDGDTISKIAGGLSELLKNQPITDNLE